MLRELQESIAHQSHIQTPKKMESEKEKEAPNDQKAAKMILVV
jgi:hypothetical protein